MKTEIKDKLGQPIINMRGTHALNLSSGSTLERQPDSMCAGYKTWTDYGYEYDCGHNTSISCDESKYGGGRKDPEAKCNSL